MLRNYHLFCSFIWNEKYPDAKSDLSRHGPLFLESLLFLFSWTFTLGDSCSDDLGIVDKLLLVECEQKDAEGDERTSSSDQVEHKVVIAESTFKQSDHDQR